MKKILKYYLMLNSCFIFAETEDLQQMMKDLDNTTVVTKAPEIPVYTPPKTNFKEYQFDNLFSQTRVSDDYATSNTLQNFNLNQLQMVGYMEQKKINYAFVKTPYETLILRSGDKIKGGTVTQVSPTQVELDEIQTQDNKVYHKKIFLKLETNRNNDFKLKLQ